VNPADFDIGALFAALDAERQSRAMTWSQVAADISRLFARTSVRPIASSTLSGMRNKRALEGDGVLQMLRWLHRSPESFAPGHTAVLAEASMLPSVGVGRILRFDTRKLHMTLDAQRIARGLTWKQVAVEIGGVSAASLTRLELGGRTAFPQVMRMTGWLGRPVASFTRAEDR